jgi:predicted TIM-barrel fold metal-dependent hydrolase
MIANDAIDCDLHLPVPGMDELLPYLDDFWRDTVVARGIKRLDLQSLGKSPLSVRPDWRLPPGQKLDPAMLRQHVLDRWQLRYAICNCLHGAIALQDEDLGSAIVSAVNDWVADQWLSREPRLKGSILVHAENPQRAAEEIDKRAGDPRFVQVILLAMQSTLYGKRTFWPVFEAAERASLAVAIHAGSLYRHPPSVLGWPSYCVNDLVNQSFAFQTQLMSLLMEGVFTKFPRLKVVLLESGFGWMPNFIWRANKTWKGTRMEIPWVDRMPGDVIREHVRIATQPFDAPGAPGRLEKVIDHIGSDSMFVFASDYPHWHFEGDEAISPDLPVGMANRLKYETPAATYARLGAAP